MDSEFDSLDDFLAVPADDDGAARKFKPKAKVRPKPRSSVVPSTLPNVKHANSTPLVLETDHEKLADVTEFCPPNHPNSIGDSEPLNNADEPQLRVSINQGGSVSTVCDGSSNGNFLEELPVGGGEGCQNNAVEHRLNMAEPASLQWNPFDDIDLGQPTSSAKDGGKFRPKFKSCSVKQTLTSAKSLRDVGVGEVLCSSVMEEHRNLHLSFADQGPTACDSSQDQSMSTVTGNRLGMSNWDPTTSNPSNIESGRMEPEYCGLFDNDDAPSIFPPADDYFSMNEHSVYNSDAGRPGPGASFPDDDMHDMHVETAHEMPAERVDDSVPAEDTRTKRHSKVPRKHKARSTQPSKAVDGGNDDFHGELRSDSAMGQDDSDDNNEKDTNLKKKGVKRSRKSVPDNVQRTRTRSHKKVNETSGEHNEKPKKKFSHSTRGRRKQVDSIFLATPDDEIDHRSVSFKDLILRAEILERDSKKVPTPSSTPAVAQRIESPSPLEEPYYGWNNYDSDQHEEYDDHPVEIQETSSYFNYHSFMKKTPRVAWSKLDTELFYQGIRQFGTDFTLIQQLFPGRTRNHIKSKYKKEERQHPKRISEAIENRSNGTAFYQQVIDQLTAADEQEDEELSDDLNGAEVNEDNVQEATVELNDNSSERIKQDDAEAMDTVESQESEKMDDDFGWDSYAYASL